MSDSKLNYTQSFLQAELVTQFYKVFFFVYSIGLGNSLSTPFPYSSSQLCVLFFIFCGAYSVVLLVFSFHSLKAQHLYRVNNNELYCTIDLSCHLCSRQLALAMCYSMLCQRRKTVFSTACNYSMSTVFWCLSEERFGVKLFIREQKGQLDL